jgi:hypothetical protein
MHRLAAHSRPPALHFSSTHTPRPVAPHTHHIHQPRPTRSSGAQPGVRSRWSASSFNVLEMTALLGASRSLVPRRWLGGWTCIGRFGFCRPVPLCPARRERGHHGVNLQGLFPAGSRSASGRLRRRDRHRAGSLSGTVTSAGTRSLTGEQDDFECSGMPVRHRGQTIKQRQQSTVLPCITPGYPCRTLNNSPGLVVDLPVVPVSLALSINLVEVMHTLKACLNVSPPIRCAVASASCTLANKPGVELCVCAGS